MTIIIINQILKININPTHPNSSQSIKMSSLGKSMIRWFLFVGSCNICCEYASNSFSFSNGQQYKYRSYELLKENVVKPVLRLDFKNFNPTSYIEEVQYEINTYSMRTQKN